MFEEASESGEGSGRNTCHHGDCVHSCHLARSRCHRQDFNRIKVSVFLQLNML